MVQIVHQMVSEIDESLKVDLKKMAIQGQFVSKFVLLIIQDARWSI
jgi:hypothetical protein